MYHVYYYTVVISYICCELYDVIANLLIIFDTLPLFVSVPILFSRSLLACVHFSVVLLLIVYDLTLGLCTCTTFCSRDVSFYVSVRITELTFMISA